MYKSFKCQGVNLTETKLQVLVIFNKLKEYLHLIFTLFLYFKSTVNECKSILLNYSTLEKYYLEEIEN